MTQIRMTRSIQSKLTLVMIICMLMLKAKEYDKISANGNTINRFRQKYKGKSTTGVWVKTILNYKMLEL